MTKFFLSLTIILVKVFVRIALVMVVCIIKSRNGCLPFVYLPTNFLHAAWQLFTPSHRHYVYSIFCLFNHSHLTPSHCHHVYIVVNSSLTLHIFTLTLLSSISHSSHPDTAIIYILLLISHPLLTSSHIFIMLSVTPLLPFHFTGNTRC